MVRQAQPPGPRRVGDAGGATLPEATRACHGPVIRMSWRAAIAPAMRRMADAPA
ncbi:hypothetical protein HMPREF0731_3951 [Pseudoroseomonas cervicalis ATCC 49957]|uniref:Uncharacterized protein n=1 Tax=Pseudoroseomonas cervicalis ATCC 49957 TaxID=525371 RepID=D5RS89_9PROT|nr:hypothetical protein HMPREF0731_3951 [Pseudoroseomonas cervicalis ATCC 49957]